MNIYTFACCKCYPFQLLINYYKLFFLWIIKKVAYLYAVRFKTETSYWRDEMHLLYMYVRTSAHALYKNKNKICQDRLIKLYILSNSHRVTSILWWLTQMSDFLSFGETILKKELRKDFKIMLCCLSICISSSSSSTSLKASRGMQSVSSSTQLLG